MTYQLRGHVVAKLSKDEIIHQALMVVKALNITPYTLKNMAQFLENLYEYGINFEIIANKDWLTPAEAVCTPENLTIVMPQKLYNKICRGTKKSVAILFHELGHIFLAHKKILNYRETNLTQYEDAEWQADMFSFYILEKIGVKKCKTSRYTQLKLPFI